MTLPPLPSYDNIENSQPQQISSSRIAGNLNFHRTPTIAPPKYSKHVDLTYPVYTSDAEVVQQQQSAATNNNNVSVIQGEPVIHTQDVPNINSRNQRNQKVRSNLLLIRIVFWIGALIIGIITGIVLIILSFTGTI